jgi:hypothetical protein
LEWGSLFQAPTTDNCIMQTAWKDNALVLFLLTIHEASSAESVVIQTRKRPAETSSAAKTAWVPFGNSPCKDLPIPKLIDDYNHHMGYVDQADQLRESKLTILLIIYCVNQLFQMSLVAVEYARVGGMQCSCLFSTQF